MESRITANETTAMKTNYFGHDAAYQTRRADGYPGWADEQTLQINLETLERELSTHYPERGGRALEIGCGAGDLSIWLAELGFDVVGIDIAPSAIEWANEKAVDHQASIDFRVGSVLELDDFPANSFDLVLDGHCLHCIIGDDRAALLANVHRVLKPEEGRFFVKTMCGDISAPHMKLSEKLVRQFDPDSRCFVSESGVATRYIGLPENILAELSRAGFQIENHRLQQANCEDGLDELTVWASK